MNAATESRARLNTNTGSVTRKPNLQIAAEPRPLPGPRALAGLRSRIDPRYRDWHSLYDADVHRGGR